jgi:hypothetical protein
VVWYGMGFVLDYGLPTYDMRHTRILKRCECFTLALYFMGDYRGG